MLYYKEKEPQEPETDIHVYKAPLYWSVYEYCWNQSKNGVANEDMDISPDEWDNIIDWVARDLKPYGYDMICTDGFIPMIADDESGYMTRYGSMPLEELIARCRAKGLKVGVYDNPLWLHGPDDTPIPGTDVTFGDLKYKSGDKIDNSGHDDTWFSWVVASHKGAKEYIDGFFKHFSEMGVDYIRIDFLSWYENGQDRSMGVAARPIGWPCSTSANRHKSTACLLHWSCLTCSTMPTWRNATATWCASWPIRAMEGGDISLPTNGGRFTAPGPQA